MIPIQVKYLNGTEKGLCVVLVEKSTDEVERILHNNKVPFTEIVSLDAPPINVMSLLKKEGINIENAL